MYIHRPVNGKFQIFTSTDGTAILGRDKQKERNTLRALDILCRGSIATRLNSTKNHANDVTYLGTRLAHLKRSHRCQNITYENKIIEKTKRFQSRILGVITRALWYARNVNIHKDLGILLIKPEVERSRTKYLTNHQLMLCATHTETPDTS